MFRSLVGCLVFVAAITAAFLSPVVAHTATVTTVHVFQGGTDGGAPAGNISIGPDGSIYAKTIENPASIVVVRLNPQTGASTPVFSGNPGASDDANSGVAFGTNGAIYGASYFNAGSGQCGAGCGLIFQISATTGSLSTIYQFLNNGDGRGTQGVIAGPGGALYGVADEGGTNQQGSIFRLDPANGAMLTIHSFNAGVDGSNADGVGIQFGPDGALYGENLSGGQYGNGTIYRIDPLTRVSRVLYNFTPTDGNTHIFNQPPNFVISDTGGTIYGTTVSGGSNGKGMIFRYVVATGVLTVLHSFNGVDGANPTRLVLGSGGDLYGLTYNGGTANVGTVFRYNYFSTAFASIYSFTNQSDGAHPGQGGLILSADGTFYGTTSSGGGAGGTGSGTVFEITP